VVHERHFGDFPISIASKSDVGLVRDNNEDAFTHMWLGEDKLLAVVADGMGGHDAGEVASGLAVQVIEEMVSQKGCDGSINALLSDAIIEANRVIFEEGEALGKNGMGTTVVVALVEEGLAHVAFVGDSPLFHVRNGHVIWRTKDHTRVQELVDAGVIASEEARLHPNSGMLTRALGHEKMSNGQLLAPEVFDEPLTLLEGDALVLCSDGVTDLVDDEELGKTVAGTTPEALTQTLINLAYSRGGHDNITVTVIVVGKCAGEYHAKEEETQDPATDTDHFMDTDEVTQDVIAPIRTSIVPVAVSPVEGPPVAVSVPVAEPSVESVIEPVIESTPPVLQEAAIPAQASTNWLMVGIILVLSVTLAAVGMMAVVFFMKPG
jgi:serine/threonine protein phosphatase PrpC